MGKILEKIYQVVEEKGGLPGRVKLAQMTGISRQQAVDGRDRAEIIRRFKKAAAEILGRDINDLLN